MAKGRSKRPSSASGSGSSSSSTRFGGIVVKALQKRVLDCLNSNVLPFVLKVLAFGVVQIAVLHIYLLSSKYYSYSYGGNSGNGSTADSLRGSGQLSRSSSPKPDNIGGKVYDDIFSPLPIDVVYTWVNGSDPVWRDQKEKSAALEIARAAAAQLNANSSSLIANNEQAATKNALNASGWLEKADIALAEAMNISKGTLDTLLVSGRLYDDNGSATTVSDTPPGHRNVTTNAFDFEAAALGEYPSLNSSVSNSSTHNGTAAYEKDESDDDDDSNRYRDNEELRYSLRSLEKYAPWIRHVYLVTDDQVPYWLNTSAHRMTVLSHKDIFSGDERKFLPLFSSPAIEARLHRIPGLSEQFIYFNDDVLLGAPVSPGDFLTSTGAQKVYLAWDVPQCNKGCIETWLTDGYCDVNCNTSACDWDGGDCIGVSKPGPVAGSTNYGSTTAYNQAASCRSSCPSHWMGDNACDHGCNHPECAYDGGDCGLDQLAKTEKITHLVISAGISNVTLKANATTSIEVATAFAGVVDASRVGHIYAVSIDLSEELERLRNETSCTSSASMKLETLKPWRITSATHDRDDVVAKATYRGPEDTLIIVFGEGKALGEMGAISVELSYGRDLNVSACVNTSRLTLHLNVTASDLASPRAAPIAATNASFANVSIANRTGVNANRHNINVTAGADVANITIASNASIRRRLMGLDSASMSTPASSGCPVMRWMKRVVGWGSQATHRRRLEREDTYAQSIVYTNRIYRKEFGKRQRKVPAHMPHLINVDTMEELQSKYHEQFLATMKHRFRHRQDMQYAFAYMYWLISKGDEPSLTPLEAFEQEFDSNSDGLIDDNELRTVAAVILGADTKLTAESINEVKDCLAPPHSNTTTIVDDEKTVHRTDTIVPHVTAKRFLNCSKVVEGLKKNWRKKETHATITDLKEVAFEMLSDDYNETLKKLDSVRARKPKFICLNDNMHHPSGGLLRELRNFYEAMLPLRSQFELREGARNRCLRPSGCSQAIDGTLIRNGDL